jgi:hypothetical protein
MSDEPIVDALARRYVVLTEGEVVFNNHIVLPGSVRFPHNQSVIPVTRGYDHEEIIGYASAFARAGVIDGISKITVNVRLRFDRGLTHEDLARLKGGVFLTNVFSFQQPGEAERWITDGIIKEISFYDPRPPALKIEES